MGKPAARIGDMHVCPMVAPGVPPIPHVGGPLMGPGVPTVLIGKMPAAVMGDMCTCVGPPANIILGSMGVFIGKKPAARMGDMTAHGGTITIGCPTVLIGESMAGGGSSGGSSSSAGSQSGSESGGGAGSTASHAEVADQKQAALSAQVRAAIDKTSLSAGDKTRLKTEVCTLTGHPVNVADGSVMTSVTDFELPGPIPLVWKRSWFSNALYQGPLGHGWFHPYDLAMEIQGDLNVIVVRLPEGILAGFPIPEPGESYFNRKDKLTLFNDGNFFYLKDQQQFTYRFRRDGTGNAFAWVHKIESIENSNGFSLRFDYDAGEVLSRIIDSAGREILFQSDALGRIVSILAPSPWNAGEKYTIASYAYDQGGNLSEAKDALQQAFTYQYQGHLLVKETNRVGLSFYFEYEGRDEKAKCLRTYGDGGIYDHKLKYFTGYTEVINSLNETTSYQHMRGLVVRTTDPLGGVSWSMYNAYNELTVEIDPMEIASTYGYDENGNKVMVINPDGTKVSIEYNALNLPEKVTDQIGGEWTYSYDEIGNLISQENPLKEKTTYDYTNGLLTALSDAAGNKTLLEYNAQHSLQRLISPDGNASSWEYDLLGRCIATTDARGNTRKMVYDLMGRATHIEEPDGNTRDLAYDGEGNILEAKDKDYVVGFEYSGMNRMKARIQAGTRVEFRYDKEEQLTAIVNEQQLAYRFELNANGQVISESGFDGLKKNYTRDAAGKVVEVVKPGEKISKYTHDLMGRVTAIEHSDGTKESFAYREDGALTEAINEHQTVQLERDILGRVTKELQGTVEVLSTYNNSGSRTAVSSSLGAQFSYLRNALGDVEEVQGTDLEVKFLRDNFGLETERTFKGGLQSRWNRDRLGRPERQETFTGAGVQRSRSYTWETNSRLSKITDSKIGTTAFGHDVFGNLSWAARDQEPPVLRMPDAVGNLFRTAEGKDRKYGAAGQLLQSGSTRYDYDPEGNLIKKSEGNGKVWKYHWNASGMLSHVVRPEGIQVSFTYDALGRRLSKSFRGETTKWVWDGNTPLHEWVENDQLTKEAQDASINAGQTGGSEALEKLKESLTTWLFEPESFAPLAKVANGKTYGIITDHLGTPLSMHNLGGETVWSAELNCYGEVQNLLGKKQDCPFRYPGQYEDIETGLYYNRFRYYAPEEGMYISQDPIGLLSGSLNNYSYIHDPNIWKDALGLNGIEWVDPSTINFSQRTVDKNVKVYTEDMKANKWIWEKSGPIRVIEVEGQLVSYDNRRLLAAQNASLQNIPIQKVNPDDIFPGGKKTWNKKFQDRFNDIRNKQAGGIVPNKGLKEKPKVCQ